MEPEEKSQQLDSHKFLPKVILADDGDESIDKLSDENRFSLSPRGRRSVLVLFSVPSPSDVLRNFDHFIRRAASMQRGSKLRPTEYESS